ncbi:hypothetical protein PFISCL1PPCAC_3230, partial [Pristionchus fissidentatus]
WCQLDAVPQTQQRPGKFLTSLLSPPPSSIPAFPSRRERFSLLSKVRVCEASDLSQREAVAMSSQQANTDRLPVKGETVREQKNGYYTLGGLLGYGSFGTAFSCLHQGRWTLILAATLSLGAAAVPR